MTSGATASAPALPLARPNSSGQGSHQQQRKVNLGHSSSGKVAIQQQQHTMQRPSSAFTRRTPQPQQQKHMIGRPASAQPPSQQQQQQSKLQSSSSSSKFGWVSATWNNQSGTMAHSSAHGIPGQGPPMLIGAGLRSSNSQQQQQRPPSAPPPRQKGNNSRGGSSSIEYFTLGGMLQIAPPAINRGGGWRQPTRASSRPSSAQPVLTRPRQPPHQPPMVMQLSPDAPAVYLTRRAAEGHVTSATALGMA